jgi:hypothetical protein
VVGLDALDELLEQVDLGGQSPTAVFADSYPGAGSAPLVAFLDTDVARFFQGLEVA